MNHLRRSAITVVLFFITTLVQAQSGSRPQPTMTAADIQLGLRKLGVVGNVLYIAAHPDDENTAMLAWLANDRLVRTGYLSMTRGDGGQNLLGDEKGELLGVIRTQELLAARRTDGAEQFFTRALDFGFTKNPEETFAIWNHDQILSDVVWVIRNFQPDVIITRFPITGEGGHGHHTASAILAEEAFDAAADPKRFPEQLQWVKPWKTTRLFWNNWLPQNEKTPPPDSHMLAIDVGRYNALLGKEYTEIAAESRTMHKSQGFGSEAKRGMVLNYLTLRKGEPAASDLLEGVDLSWKRIAGSETVSTLIEEANRKFDPAHPEATVPALITIAKAIDALPDKSHIAQKRRDLTNLIRATAGLWTEAIVDRPLVGRGEKLDVKVTAVSRAATDLELRSVDVTTRSGTAGSDAAPHALALNTPVTSTIALDTTSLNDTTPYWLQSEPDAEPGKPAGRFHVTDQQLIGKAENPPPVAARLHFGSSSGEFDVLIPVLYRWTDRVRGEQYRSLSVGPELVSTFDRRVYLYPDSKTHDISVRASNETASPKKTTISLEIPAGWKSSPVAQSLELDPWGSQTVSFHVTPPANDSSGSIRLVSGEGATLSPVESEVTIDYPHIPAQTLFSPAAARLVRSDIKHTGKRIGYIAGSGDEVPAALEQIGYEVHLLTDTELAAPLAQYDAIVVGVRAFNVRETMKTQLPQLLRYVENGGTMIVQYNTADQTLAKQLGPYPLTLSSDRVTVEDAPISILAADDPILMRPNKITAADFNGWVQERGLYFASKWDEHYHPLLSSHDPGEKDLPGGLLVAKYGKGMYILTGYSFFRQLPAGVPGAYKLFANLVSARQ